MSKKSRQRFMEKVRMRDSLATAPAAAAQADETAPDWESKCCVCDQSPIVPATGMCGPCTFGDASTADGNW